MMTLRKRMGNGLNKSENTEGYNFIFLQNLVFLITKNHDSTSTKIVTLILRALLIFNKVPIVGFVLPASILDILDFSKSHKEANSC